MKTDTLIILVVVVGIISLLVWAVKEGLNQSKRDWDKLYYLQAKCNKIETKKDLVEFYEEFVEAANKIHNQYIQKELALIYGYLKGLNKTIK